MVASAEHLPAAVGRTPRLPFRLARAELLKLRSRRGLMVTAALLTIGATIVMFVAFEAFYLSNSAKYGPAGGLDHFSRWVFVLSQLGAIAAVLVGASAGADDLGAGVFRELVATGRSRRALYLARIPAGVAINERPPTRGAPINHHVAGANPPCTKISLGARRHSASPSTHQPGGVPSTSSVPSTSRRRSPSTSFLTEASLHR